MSQTQDQSSGSPIVELESEKLSSREHLDPDKHWIGEALPAASYDEIAPITGTLSSTGASPFVARADHTHRVDPLVLPRSKTWTPSISNHTLGTDGFRTGRVIVQKVSDSVITMVDLTLYVAYGSGGGPTGDLTVVLPYTCVDKFVGYGEAESIQRFSLDWYTLSIGGDIAAIRAVISRPTAATVNSLTETTVTMDNILPAQSWGSGSWIMLYGKYFTEETP